MKALSIKQPWLYCITDLDKRIENRNWPPPRWLLGNRFALHASARMTTKLEQSAASQIAGVDLSHLVGEMPLGAIVATARLSQYFLHPCHGGRSDREVDRWSFGPYCWGMSDVQKLITPIPCKGALGLWEWEAEN